MTSAIEKLGHMLDERGVDYETYGNDSFTETCWLDAAGKAAVFAECDDGDTSFACETWDFTPEQAIVATLGYSTLTAWQVKEAAHGHYNLRMVSDVDGLAIPQVIFDWQAIADELNAVMGARAVDA